MTKRTFQKKAETSISLTIKKNSKCSRIFERISAVIWKKKIVILLSGSNFLMELQSLAAVCWPVNLFHHTKKRSEKTEKAY